MVIRALRSRRGYTLVEILITIAIMGVLAMFGPTLMTQITKFFVLSRAKLDLQQQARAAMYIITRELRQAQSNTITVDEVSGQPYYSRIKFTKVQGAVITINQSNNQLILTEGTDTSVLSKNLAYLAFTFPRSDDMTMISVSLTLEEQIYGGLLKALNMASEQVEVMN